MRIIFVRHGEPDYALDCLTAEGRLQAAAAAERLRNEGIEEIYASPLGRAAETAAAASKVLGLPVRTLDYMRELHWGSADGEPLLHDGHPWDLADELARQGWNLADPSWREHPYFARNLVTAEADYVAEKTDEWLLRLGYAGSSAAAMAHILNLPFPYACGLFHLEFTGITILRLDRRPGAQALPCLELANDARHLRGPKYHRLADM